jgi:hypothetical protein
MGNCRVQRRGKGHRTIKESINPGNSVLPGGPESQGVIRRDSVMSSRLKEEGGESEICPGGINSLTTRRQSTSVPLMLGLAARASSKIQHLP